MIRFYGWKEINQEIPAELSCEKKHSHSKSKKGEARFKREFSLVVQR
jgi:hypothetical protein